MNNTTYVENGILYFNELKDARLKIATTYDNSIWGNMNPYFEKTVDEERVLRRRMTG